MKRNKGKGCMVLIVAAMLLLPAFSYADEYTIQTPAAAGLDVLWLPEGIVAFSGFGDDGLFDVVDDKTARFGYINTDGKLVIPAKFVSVKPFSDRIAKVEVSRYVYGYIDTQGNSLFGKTYSYCNSFQNGYASYKNPDDPDEWGLMDQTGKTIFTMKCKRLGSLSEGMISYEDQNGNWGFVDEKGNVVIPAQYQNPTNDDPYFSEGLAAVEKNGKCGYIDPKGNTGIGFEYSKTNPFSDGVAVVKSMNGAGEYAGLIDKNQQVIIPMQYGNITNSSEGIVSVSASGAPDVIAFFTDTGKQITGFDYCYDSMNHSFHDGIAVVQTTEGGASYGGINRYGQIVIPFGIFFSSTDFHEGLSTSVVYTDGGGYSCIVKRPASADVDTGVPTFIQVDLNGKALFLNTNPIMEKDRVLVPVRGVFEGMGGAVSWDDASKTVTVKKGDQTLVLKVGSTDAYVNGKEVQLGVPPEIKNNQMLIPVRFISENLGMKVSWDGKKEIVNISSGAETN